MKKTIKKRAFVSAIAMLIVSAIVLTSSTFAWFSMSKQATVEEMNLTVSSPEGIQISANAKGWTASLTQDNLFDNDPEKANSTLDAYQGNHNYLTTALVPVSSGMGKGNSTTGYAEFYKINLDDNNRETCTLVDQVNSSDPGFVAFDIFLKVATDGTKVYFGKNSTFTDSTEGGQGPLTALRVGFQILGNVSADATQDQALALKSFAKANNTIYEPESFNRSMDAVQAGQTDGVLITNYMNGIINGLTVNANKVIDRRNDGTCVSETSNELSGVKFYKSSVDKNAASFTLNAGITKLRVYIWMEGQDVDCRNSVASSSITANLKFDID